MKVYQIANLIEKAGEEPSGCSCPHCKHSRVVKFEKVYGDWLERFGGWDGEVTAEDVAEFIVQLALDK